jgi:hypothetical protein
LADNPFSMVPYVGNLMGPTAKEIAKPKPWKGRKITGPKGTRFTWTKDTPPTAEDFDAMEAADRYEYDRKLSKGAPDRNPETTGAPVPPARKKVKTQIRAGTPDDPKPVSDVELQADLLQAKNPKLPRHEAMIHAARSLKGMGAGAVEGANQAQQMLSSAIAPVMGPVGEALGFVEGMMPSLTNLGSRLAGTTPQKLGKEMAPQAAAGLVTAPLSAVAELMQLADDKASPETKARAAGNLIAAGVLSELPMGGSISIAQKAAQSLLAKMGKTKQGMAAIQKAKAQAATVADVPKTVIEPQTPVQPTVKASKKASPSVETSSQKGTSVSESQVPGASPTSGGKRERIYKTATPTSIDDIKVGDVFKSSGNSKMSVIGGTITKITPTTVTYEGDYMGKLMQITVKKSELSGQEIKVLTDDITDSWWNDFDLREKERLASLYGKSPTKPVQSAQTSTPIESPPLSKTSSGDVSTPKNAVSVGETNAQKNTSVSDVKDPGADAKVTVGAGIKGNPHIEADKTTWYHGTSKVFEGELSDKGLHNDLGIFLTSDKNLASEYTKLTPFSKEPPSGTLVEASVKPKRVYDIRFGSHNPEEVGQVLDAMIARATRVAESDSAYLKASSAIDKFQNAKKGLLEAKTWQEWKRAEADLYDATMKLSVAEGAPGWGSNAPLREELRRLGYDAIRKVDDGSDTLAVLDPTIIKRKAPAPPENRVTSPASVQAAKLVPDAPKTVKADPPVSKPKAETSEAKISSDPNRGTEEPKATGISHAEVDSLRKEIGWQPRNPTQAKPDADLLQESKKLTGKERTVADRVMSDEDGKVTLSDPEAVALGNKLKKLKREMLDAKAKDDVEAFDLADEEAQRIADALDESGTRQGRAFRARRFLFDGQEDSWTLNRRAKKANLDQPLNTKQQAHLDKQIKELEAANATLKAERDAAVQKLDLFKSAAESKRSKGPMTAQARRTAALNSLRKLGIPTAEDIAKNAPTGGGMKSKQSGAVRIPEGETEQVAKAVRMLVRSYEGQGLDNWDKVLGKLKQDLPGIDEEQALWILSGNYKQAKLEADLAKRNVNRFMSDVNRDAKYRSKPFFVKAMQFGVDALSTTQRSLQTTLDDSLALIQMKNVLMWKPGTWMKGVGKSLQAGLRHNPIEFARREMTKVENHPLYARAVKAKLGLSDVDGAFNKQEEFFAGRLENHVPGIANSKAMATVLANQMRFDLFRKLAAAGPDTPEYLEDIARQINIATGKGSGHIAELLGSKPAGFISYAPRFYWSSWQHTLGVPLFSAKTAAGKGQALKMYGTQLAFYGLAIKVAQEFGFEVELDPRSQNFGVATAKDGSYSFDLFKKQAEPIRVGAQMLYGKFSKKGKFTKATDSYQATDLYDYAEQKASPVLRMTKMAATGSVYDDTIGEQRTAKVSDFWGSYIPLSIKEMMKNKDKPGTFPASFFGANIDKGQKLSGSKPFGLVPPGVRKMMGGG